MYKCMSYASVSGRTRVQVHICLMQSIYSFFYPFRFIFFILRLYFFNKKQKIDFLFLFDFKVCSIILCASLQLNKEKVRHEIFHLQIEKFAWNSGGLGVVISFRYAPADRPGGEGGEKHATEITPSDIYHSFIKKSQSTFWYFQPNFLMQP